MNDVASELSRRGAEVWRAIPGYDGYHVSNLGRIRSEDHETRFMCRGKMRTARYRGRILKPVRHKSDGIHWNVTLSSHAPRLIHQLVMLAFVGPIPRGLETRHLDGDGGNNALYNLEYGTKRQNRLDDVRNGIYDRASGGKARNVKLTEAQVLEIKVRLSATKVCDLAREFGVTWAAIAAIKSGRNWGHLTRDAA